jgi:dipeptidyl aminopeptidase/acylaminoacyl peptidase
VKRLAGPLALVLALLATPLAAQAPAAPAGPPTGPLSPNELFADRRLMAEVSPSGRYLALAQKVGGKDRLVIIDLQTRSRSEIFNDPRFDLTSIHALYWKGDERLVFMQSAFSPKRDKDGDLVIKRQQFGNVATVAEGEFRFLYAIARTGGEVTRLPAPIKGELGPADAVKLRGNSFHVISGLPSDERHMLVVRGSSWGGGYWPYRDWLDLLKLDVVTGALEVVDRGGPGTRNWEVDERDGKAILRFDVNGWRGGWKVMARTGGDDDWSLLFTIRERDVAVMPELEILGSTDKPGSVYVAVDAQDRALGDTRELRRYDFVSKTMGERIWAHPKYDLSDIVRYDDGTVAATCYWAEVYRCDYLDPARAREMAAVDRFFEGQRSVRPVSQSRDGAIQVLAVSGPDEPGSLYLFDRKAGTVNLLGAQWPKLAPDRLGVVKSWTWAAKDGTPLGGYLTSPPPVLRASGPLPLVVLPHGGPEVRDHLDFDRLAQGFAARGYLVFQPNFRGSGGFGAGFAEQGYGQWGLRMQDDVIDGVEALIRSGQVDPARICIVGASYGGYVALQGGAKRPDLFKCVVSRAGLSDLVRSQKWEAETFEKDSPRYKYWLKSVGDPKADAAKLAAASPVTYAADYQPPVLLMHGVNDWNVPIEQSKIMEKALTKAGKTVTLTEYAGGHSGWGEVQEAKALTEMIVFVDRYIGPKR